MTHINLNESELAAICERYHRRLQTERERSPSSVEFARSVIAARFVGKTKRDLIDEAIGSQTRSAIEALAEMSDPHAVDVLLHIDERLTDVESSINAACGNWENWQDERATMLAALQEIAARLSVLEESLHTISVVARLARELRATR